MGNDEAKLLKAFFLALAVARNGFCVYGESVVIVHADPTRGMGEEWACYWQRQHRWDQRNMTSEQFTTSTPHYAVRCTDADWKRCPYNPEAVG